MISLPVRPMDNQRMDELIRKLAGSVEGENGFWRFELDSWLLVVMTDESHNRMRAMTAVIEEEQLTEELISIVLAANFDRALDVRYATANGFLWSVYTHPLAELTDEQFFDALQQVVKLAKNFGTSFASSDLIFGNGE